MDAQPPSIRDVVSTLRRLASVHPDDEEVARLLEWATGMLSAESPRARSQESFRDFLCNDFQQHLHQEGITSGRVLEVGGPYNSFAGKMPEFEFDFLSLYPDPGFDNIVVADAVQADHLEPNQYDAIYSTSVFEHINKPWLAADNLTRLLRPGGVMYHAAPFSYFYHGAPADFWRYTPDAMSLLFSRLRPVKAEFFGRNRRRDNRGSVHNPVDRDGGSQFSVDAFGGWRENWFTLYVGVKDPDYARERLRLAKLQTVVNVMKQLVMAGVAEEEAARRIADRLATVRVTRDQELHEVPPNRSSFRSFDPERVLNTWRNRGRDGIPKVGYNRYTQSRRLGLE